MSQTWHARTTRLHHPPMRTEDAVPVCVPGVRGPVTLSSGVMQPAHHRTKYENIGTRAGGQAGECKGNRAVWVSAVFSLQKRGGRVQTTHKKQGTKQGRMEWREGTYNQRAWLANCSEFTHKHLVWVLEFNKRQAACQVLRITQGRGRVPDIQQQQQMQQQQSRRPAYQSPTQKGAQTADKSCTSTCCKRFCNTVPKIPDRPRSKTRPL